MSRIRFLTVVLLVMVWTTPIQAQRAYIDFTKPAFSPIAIAVPDFKFLSSEQTQLSREMSEALARDLEFSGIFRPLDPRGFLEDPQTMGLNANEISFPNWQRLGAEFLVRAAYQVQGSSVRLEARLFDVFGSRMNPGKGLRGGDQELASHDPSVCR